jgi:Flp pilus assembly protein TadD
MYKGMIYYKQGLFENSLDTCNLLVSIDPTDSPAWSNRGFALLKLGKITDAIRSFDRALALDPFNADAREGRITAIQVNWPSYKGP